MPPIPGMVHWHSLVARHAKSLKVAYHKAVKALDAQLLGRQQAQLEPLLARSTPKQPVHPVARLRQSQSRWYSTARGSVDATVRHFTTSTSGRAGLKYDCASFPKSRISSYISQSSGRAPFASTLRPNLTGGTLGRTAGGYGLGSGRVGGARFFSHGPASQAQVVQNVSQAVRAFFISGQKAQFDGVSPRTGTNTYKAVSTLQHETGNKLRSLPVATPGSWIDFQVNPTITALTSLDSVMGFGSSTKEPSHLNTDGLLDVLSVDFSRALKELAAVLNDLKKLSALGDLPISYHSGNIRVHFPGCDADTVENLCAELSVTRGTVTQDEAFDAFAGTEIALLLPFAPSNEASECESLFEEPMPTKHVSPLVHLEDMLTPSESPEEYSTHSDSGLEDVIAENPWLSSPSGFESVRSGSLSMSDKHNPQSPLEYQEFEGIYRFIEQCDAARR